MAGLVPAIHDWGHKPCQLPWMPGTRPGMTVAMKVHHLNAVALICGRAAPDNVLHVYEAPVHGNIE